MDKIEELLTRGVDKVYPSKDELEKVLRSGKKLRLYQGFDPTGTQLHIGHMVGLMKLKQWQDLGHHVIFLIGDGTGQAGDPSGKTKSRGKFLNRDELRQNAKDYVMQASKIVRFEGENPVEILYNGDWLNKLTYAEILEIAGHFSWQQLAERDLFQERMKKGETLNFRESLYPLFQAYDSVAMDVDLEIGGSDQMFNMLCGRTLMKGMKNKEKFVITTPLLADSQGNKIGKSEGNAIAITDKPEDLYAKVMAFPDSVIGKAFECLTTIPMEEVKEIEKKVVENPMQYKKKLAFEFVKQLNDEASAQKAQKVFEQTVQQDEMPTDIPEVKISPGEKSAEELLVETTLVLSRSEAKRLVEQGGVYINNIRVESSRVSIKDGDILQVGKRKFVKLKLAH